MSTIDPTARVEEGAVIGEGASIGPYCVIGPDVAVGEGCRLIAHVHVAGHTTIGARTSVYPFVSLGTPPQSVKYRGGRTRLMIGADCDAHQFDLLKLRPDVITYTRTSADRSQIGSGLVSVSFAFSVPLW